jgi:hypothetical protein
MQTENSLAFYKDGKNRLAIQSGGEIVWDPKDCRIVSPEPLDERNSHPVRGEWKQA